MRILGLHGWAGRCHDPSACLVEDGVLLRAAEEERFLRRRYAFGALPHNAAAFCLESLGLTLDEVDAVAFGWDVLEKLTFRQRGRSYDPTATLTALLPTSQFPRHRDPPIHFVDHHLAHAAAAFYASGFREAAVLVIDGQGESASTSIYSGRGGTIRKIWSAPIHCSLGYFYESLNTFIGFSNLASGKTMGLAAYGRPTFSFDNIRVFADGTYDVDLGGTITPGADGLLDEQPQMLALWREHFIQRGWKPNASIPCHALAGKGANADANLYQDIAASGQKVINDVVIHLAQSALRNTESNNLCIAGGVALNAVANGEVLRRVKPHGLFVFPAANDAGVSVGAAYVASLERGVTAITPPSSMALGPRFDDGVLADALRCSGLKYREVASTVDLAAEQIIEGAILGWFSDRMEFGPRALGNRSIIASPSHDGTRARVNAMKGREPWRPLSPAVTPDVVRHRCDVTPSPFMTVTTTWKPRWLEQVSQVTHVDGTSRAQLVDRPDNPFFHLLDRLSDQPSGSCILNTSFNFEGEPIICSPGDALGAFGRSTLDCLYLGPFQVWHHR